MYLDGFELLETLFLSISLSLALQRTTLCFKLLSGQVHRYIYIYSYAQLIIFSQLSYSYFPVCLAHISNRILMHCFTAYLLSVEHIPGIIFTCSVVGRRLSGLPGSLHKLSHISCGCLWLQSTACSKHNLFIYVTIYEGS